jgi:hypothetical protein
MAAGLGTAHGWFMVRERLLQLWAFLVPFSLALGIMLSPENLVILGQQAGAAEGAVFLGLAAATGIHFLTARTYGASIVASAHPQEAGHFPKPSRLSIPVALSLASRLSFALWGVTAFLVTAGYVFNETFWRAYPNLGFSFTLLAILVALNLLGTRCAGISQVVFLSGVLAGLLALIVTGFKGSPKTILPSPAWLSLKKGYALSPSLLFLFIGYELSSFIWGRTRKSAVSPAAPMVAGIIAAACVFSLWCFISLSYIPSLKLQESTIPYAYVARAVAGQTGRVLMGVALLAGTLAASNALLLTVPLMAASLPSAGLLSVILRSRVLILLLLGGGIALVMALGFGGSSYLPFYVKASALLWLLSYALQHLTRWRRPGRGQVSVEPALVDLACALVLAGAVALALVTDPAWAIIGAYMILLVGALILMVSVSSGTGKKITGSMT